MILEQRELLTLAKSEVTVGRLEIERLKLMLAKARREQFGQSSERGRLLVEQLELAIEDMEETQAEQESKAEIAAPEAAKQKRAQNRRPPRRPLPDNLPVERIVEPAPCACGKCGSERLHKLGEVVSKTLECEPRRWKIIEHVREKFSCRDCEAITEAPAPSHPIPRGFAGPSLLAMVLVNKFLLHQPLNRQSKTYAREGIEIDVVRFKSSNIKPEDLLSSFRNAYNPRIVVTVDMILAFGAVAATRVLIDRSVAMGDDTTTATQDGTAPGLRGAR